jgi:hypothetical protein
LFARHLKPFFDSIGQKQTSTGYSITSSAIRNKRWRNGDREPSQASGFELAKIDLRRSIAAIVTAISCLSFRVDVQN